VPVLFQRTVKEKLCMPDFSLPMFYEDTGWTDFELYEYVL
jgi:hypothetical protein